MMLYYKAVRNSGEVVFGNSSSAAGEKALIVHLQSQGLIPLRISERPLAQDDAGFSVPKASPQKMRKFTLFARKVDARTLISFAEDVAVLLEAGISLSRGLAILQELNQEHRTFSLLLGRVNDDLREGSMFWEALGKQGTQFPPVFVNMVRAGETGGALPTILSRLAAYLEELQELKEFLRGAMIYPAILTFTSLISMVLMLTLVVPKFAQVFQDMGMALPALTQAMFTAGNVLKEKWWVMTAIILGSCFFISVALRTEAGRLFWDRMVLRLPALGVFKRKIEIARFCRTLGTLLDSGVPILQSMQIVQGVVINSVLNRAILQAHDDLKRGVVLSTSLDRSDLFPSLAINMIGVGEETGRLGQMLDKVGQLYDKELKKGIKTFSSFFEPMVLLVMGTLIGGMVISMLMAIFSINDMKM